MNKIDFMSYIYEFYSSQYLTDKFIWRFDAVQEIMELMLDNYVTPNNQQYAKSHSLNVDGGFEQL